MPCNTAYVFEQAIIDAVKIPLISIIDATIDAVPDSCDSVGLLATEGCLQAGVYQRGLAARQLTALEPTAGEMQKLMRAIYAIKAGKADAELVGCGCHSGRKGAGTIGGEHPRRKRFQRAFPRFVLAPRRRPI